MSDSQSYEEIAVVADGVTVVKRFEEDEFPVPAIAFEFESDRDEEITVRMSDTVPEGIEVEDLGFHPEYGSEYWMIDDDTITFERDLAAGSSYTTVYGIRATGSDDVEQFLTEPTIEEVEPPLTSADGVAEDPEDIVPESDDNVVKEAISGDGEIPGLEDEDEEGEGDEEDVATLELNDPTASGTADGTDATGSDASDGAEGVSVNGSLVGALANEIRQQNVSGEDVKLLRRALDLAAEDNQTGGGVETARIEQLQTDIADLRAYTAALEEFLDENGTGDELIEEFETELDTFKDRLDELQTEISDNSSELGELGEDVESVSSEMESVNETVDEVDEGLEDVESELETVSDDVDEVSTEVESVSEELDGIESTMADLESSMEELEEKVTDGEVVERVDDVESDIEELRTWQEQIKQTFGG